MADTPPSEPPFDRAALDRLLDRALACVVTDVGNVGKMHITAMGMLALGSIAHDLRALVEAVNNVRAAVHSVRDAFSRKFL